MENRKSLVQWIKEHKKELLIAGVSISTLTLIMLGLKNADKIKDILESMNTLTDQAVERVSEAPTIVTVEIPSKPPQDVMIAVASNSGELPIEVSRHIRNLPQGWHASPEKIAEALDNNIILADGQTWVDTYVKGGAAA